MMAAPMLSLFVSTTVSGGCVAASIISKPQRNIKILFHIFKTTFEIFETLSKLFAFFVPTPSSHVSPLENDLGPAEVQAGLDSQVQLPREPFAHSICSVSRPGVCHTYSWTEIVCISGQSIDFKYAHTLLPPIRSAGTRSERPGSDVSKSRFIICNQLESADQIDMCAPRSCVCWGGLRSCERCWPQAH